MLLKRFYHDGLAQASYLLGCQATGEAIVIDANRDPLPYLAAAAANGVRITHVTETHIHADFLSGSRELARRTGAQLLLSAAGGPEWQYAFAGPDGARVLRDGDEVRVGNVRLDVVHTPGHTPEHLVLVATDLPASDKPLGAFSGDFLFAGDVGRPDLLERAADYRGTMRASARQLYDSLQRFVARYPDYLQIWPGHGSGSACGKSLGAVPMSTLGYEKIANWALRAGDAEAFVNEVLAGQPDPPRYFAAMKTLNRLGPPVLGAPPSAPRLVSDQLATALGSGDRVVDVRSTADYAAGLIPGTINLPLNTSLVSRAGWFLAHDRPFWLLTGSDDDGPARAALAELSLIGLDRCMGWFGNDVIQAARERGTLDRVAQVSASGLAGHLSRGDVTVVDVRNTDEWDAGHIDGAVHIPLGMIEERLGAIADGRPVVLHCQGGGRSSVAASLLKARGVAAVHNLDGGYAAWVASGHAAVQAAKAGARG